jgi:hypothetical protein
VLDVGTKLHAIDRGFGTKDGVIVENHPSGEYVIKWNEHPEPLIYGPIDDVDGKVRDGFFVVVP